MNLLDLMVKIGVDDQVTDKLGKIGGSIKSGLGGAAKVGAAAVTATAAAAAGMATAVGMAAGDVAEYGDNIDKMSQKMGLSAEKYQEWDAVLRHSGSSMESMKASMKTLANAAQGNSEAFEKLGLSQEQVASMSQEELFEATIAGLQNVSDTTERTYLAGKLLGRGATELGALLNTSAEDTQAMRDRVHELGGVMSDEAVKASARYQDSLQDMQAALSGMKNSMVSEFLPGMATVMDGLSEIFSGDSSGGAAVVSDGVQQMVSKLGESIPKFTGVINSLTPVLLQAAVSTVTAIVKQVPSMVSTIVPAIVSMAPTLLEAGIEMFMGLVDALTETGPELIDNLLDTAMQLVDIIAERGPDMLVAGVELIATLGIAIAKKLPEIITRLVTGVARLITGVVSAAPRMLAAGVKLLGGMLSGVVQGIGKVVTKVKEIPGKALNALGNIGTKLLSAGADLVNGFISGIKGKMDDLATAVKNGVDNAVGGLKNFLGIKSPSRLFAKLGRFTMDGFIQGIESRYGALDSTMADMSSHLTATSPTVSMRGTYGRFGSGDVYNVSLNLGADSSANELALAFARAIENRNALSGRGRGNMVVNYG